VTEPTPVVDLGPLGFDSGAHVLVKLALALPSGAGGVRVVGTHPDLVAHLRAWCSAQGRRLELSDDHPPFVGARNDAGGRWALASRAGSAELGSVADHADGSWGLAARGTWVEAGGPTPRFALDHKDQIWADDAVRLYDRALSSQWDPATAVPWTAPRAHPAAIEHAVVQVMAFLVENEQAALVVPARFLGQIHPHFVEIQHLLAVQIADEARHAHVFARRGALDEPPETLSTAGGRASLQTLLDEPDFAIAGFLLSVLGEGTFLSLLGFLERHAPDECTRTITRLVRADEARHVAYGVAHLERHCALDPTLRRRLATAVEHRYDALRSTAGLNSEVFDSLVLLAAGALDPSAIAQGWAAVQQLQRDMNDGRAARLARLGFTAGEAAALASLHTRNFM
jgi:hypothetical protein